MRRIFAIAVLTAALVSCGGCGDGGQASRSGAAQARSSRFRTLRDPMTDAVSVVTESRTGSETLTWICGGDLLNVIYDFKRYSSDDSFWVEYRFPPDDSRRDYWSGY